MSITYFKPHDRFDFSGDTLDIGNPVSWKRAHFLKHFFKRVFTLGDSRLEEFYQYHLAYYLANHADGNEEVFFKYLWDTIERQLKVLTGKDVYDKDHIQNQRQIDRLQKFTDILISHDQWSFHKSNDAVIAQQDSEIFAFKQQIAGLKSELKKATSLETEDQIRIAKGYLLALVDLCQQLQELKVDERTELLLSQTQAVWMKMICKYFTEGNDPIFINTLKRYFPADKKSPGVKHAPVPAEYKLFRIVPAKKRS